MSVKQMFKCSIDSGINKINLIFIILKFGVKPAAGH